MSLATELCGLGMPPGQANRLATAIAGGTDFGTVLDDLATNLTSTAAELNALHSSGLTANEAAALHGNAATVSWAVAAGAANICIITGTVKDSAGATIAAVHVLEVYMSTQADGSVISATSYSTGASITTGAAIVTQTASKAWKIATNSSGVFAISITATGKPATEYAVATFKNRPVVSAASGTSYG